MKRDILSTALVAVLTLFTTLATTQGFAQTQAQAQAQTHPHTPSPQPDLEETIWTLVVQDTETGEDIVAIRPHILMTPASTMKVVSTATALSMMSPVDSFPTYIATDATLDDGVLQGDLYIIGSGDPSIGSRYLWGKDKEAFFKQVTQALKARGIRRIAGKVIAHTPAGDFQAVNPRYPAYDMGNHYATGHYALNLFDNAYTVHLTNHGKAHRIEPEVPGLRLTPTFGFSRSRYSDSLYIAPFPLPDGSYPITGAYPVNVAKVQIKGALPHPPLFMAQYLTSHLKSSGIQVESYAETLTDLPTNLTTLYTYSSPSLRELITLTNQYSLNLYAEALLRVLGRGVTPLPGHNLTQTAIMVVEKHWYERGLETKGLEMLDGSGLSPENKVTAHFLASLLGKMQRAGGHQALFYSMLPRAGKDGTLSFFLKETHLTGKARLKSGSIRNVICYAGYIPYQGKIYSIAFMVNNYFGRASTVRKAMEEVILEMFPKP